jgi:mono/diheme cytochrome c family protein
MVSGIRLCLATALALMAVTVSGEESAGEASARGEEIFAEFCQGCHGENKSGLINFSRSRDELQAILEGETDQMPDFYGIFSESEADDIYAYLTVPAAP